MNLADITPVILTYNEAPNIGRCLEKLVWAKDIVVVDSFSTDETLAIMGEYSQVRMFQRRFDSHSQQWNFGINQTNIAANWVLALDADYILTEDFIKEVNDLNLNDDTVGYNTSFLYRIKGRILRASIYPPVTVLYRKKNALYVQDGHTQRVALTGDKQTLKSPILHDDRKSFRRWRTSQEHYADLEATALVKASWSDLRWQEKVRCLGVSPILVAIYCLFVKKLIFDGLAGIFYTGQRVFSEMILVKHLIIKRFG